MNLYIEYNGSLSLFPNANVAMIQPNEEMQKSRIHIDF